jgi:peptidoglycan biosynthesis protein MviN/MurJ (putative lipid II flippase)
MTSSGSFQRLEEKGRYRQKIIMEHEHQQNRENTKVAKAAGVVGLATMLSRIFGFIRDMVVAAFFGAGLITDAFFVAFRIPNLLRRLLGEGSLTVSFVPVFTEYLNKKSKEEAFELANIVFTILSITLVVVSIAGVIFSPLIVTIMAPGFTRVPAQYDLTVFLNRLMFPYIFFISLVALCMGILNSLRHFAAPALSPVILNIAMILATLTLRDFFREPIVALAVGVMIGGILQLAMQWPFMVRLGVRLKPDFHFRHSSERPSTRSTSSSGPSWPPSCPAGAFPISTMPTGLWNFPWAFLVLLWEQRHFPVFRSRFPKGISKNSKKPLPSLSA